MKRRILALVFVAGLCGCAEGGTSSSATRGADDATRQTPVNATRDSQSGAGATDMRGSGRGGEHRPEKH